MPCGNWQTTHQGIAIADSGRLLDGQHRLHAVVKSGVTVTMTIARGCKEDSFEMLDCGVKRTDTDITGIKATVVGTIKKVMSYTGGVDKRKRVSPSKIKEFYEANDVILEAISITYKKGVVASVRASMFIYILNGGDIEKVKSFYKFLQYGTIDSVTPAMSNVGMRVVTSDRNYRDTLQCSTEVYKAMTNDGLKVVRGTEKERVAFTKLCEKAMG